MKPTVADAATIMRRHCNGARWLTAIGHDDTNNILVVYYNPEKHPVINLHIAKSTCGKSFLGFPIEYRKMSPPVPA